MPMTSSFPHRKGILKSLAQQKPVNENSGLADGVDHQFGLNGPHDDLKGVAAPPGYESPPRRSIPQSWFVARACYMWISVLWPSYASEDPSFKWDARFMDSKTNFYLQILAALKGETKGSNQANV